MLEHPPIYIVVLVVIIAIVLFYFAYKGINYYFIERNIKKQLQVANRPFVRQDLTVRRQVLGYRPDIEKSGLLYWGEIDGHKLYYWQSIDYMHQWRVAAISLGALNSDFNIVESSFRVWLEALEREFNKSDMVAQGALIKGIHEYMDGGYGNYDVAMYIAGCGILVDGEPVHEFSEKHNKIKEQLLEKHTDVRAFFLNTACMYLKWSNPDSHISEIKGYWMSPQGKRMALFLSEMTQMPQFKNIWRGRTEKSSGWQSKLVNIARMIWVKKRSPSTTNI